MPHGQILAALNELLAFRVDDNAGAGDVTDAVVGFTIPIANNVKLVVVTSKTAPAVNCVGSWSDAGHPTGRKVTFVNRLPSMGTTSIFPLPASGSGMSCKCKRRRSLILNSIAESIQKIAAEDTAANAKVAQQEWDRVTPCYAKRAFSAAPSMIVRPTEIGMSIHVRYIPRANERHEVRARLYRAIVELLNKKQISGKPVSQSAAD